MIKFQQKNYNLNSILSLKMEKENLNNLGDKMLEDKLLDRVERTR